MYRNTESLCYVLRTNIVVWVNYTSIFKMKKLRKKQLNNLSKVTQLRVEPGCKHRPFGLWASTLLPQRKPDFWPLWGIKCKEVSQWLEPSVYEKACLSESSDRSHTTAGVQVQVGLPLGQTNQSLTIQSIIHGLAAMTLLGGLIEFQAPPQAPLTIKA